MTEGKRFFREENTRFAVILQAQECATPVTWATFIWAPTNECAQAMAHGRMWSQFAVNLLRLYPLTKYLVQPST